MLHKPVFLEEAVGFLGCKDGGIYVDVTSGYGGHSEALLQASSPGGRLIGIDRDTGAIRYAGGRLAGFGGRVTLLHGRFGDIRRLVESCGVSGVDGILADLGVSSPQLDVSGRGFSFKNDGPLDMRMDETSPLTAEIIVNEYSRETLAEIISEYGEERYAGRVAAYIETARRSGRIVTTGALAAIVRRAVGGKWGRIDPSTRTFQALRIAVNGELDELEALLADSPGLLNPGGRMCVISYHSLEDRLVKRCFKGLSSAGFELLTKKPLQVQETEARENPRARSAKLRAIKKSEGETGD